MARTTPDRPAPKVRAVDHSVHTSPLHCGNTVNSWGFLSKRLTVPKPPFRMPATPNTAMGTGTGWNRHRGGRVTALNPRGRDPGEDPEKCSGRTAARPIPRGVGGSATGTRVSRPEEQDRTVRPGQVPTDKTPTGPDTDRVRRRRRADGAAGREPGTEYRGPPGRSGAVGHRNGGTVGLSPDGGSLSSQVRSAGRRVGGTGSERSPSGQRSQGRLPERVASQVAVGRRNGSEELTGSPGGYSGPLSRFFSSRVLYGT